MKLGVMMGWCMCVEKEGDVSLCVCTGVCVHVCALCVCVCNVLL